MTLSQEEIQFKILEYLENHRKKFPTVYPNIPIIPPLDANRSDFEFVINYLIEKKFIEKDTPLTGKITVLGIDWLKEMREKKSKTLEIKYDSKEYIQLYDKMINHNKIKKASEKLFKSCSYRNAVLDAFIIIENMVKEKAKYPKEKGSELSGRTLMRHVFNIKRPLLKWSNLETDSEKNELEGYSNIFAGAMQGIRNPKAHGVFEQTPMRALQLLILANLLAEIIDDSDLVNYHEPENQVEL